MNQWYVVQKTDCRPVGGKIADYHTFNLVCIDERPMTLHRYRPEVEKMLIPVDGFEAPRSLWHTDPVFRSRVLAEWDKIEPHTVKGFIVE